MKKRLFSLVFALMLVIGLLPGTVQAGELDNGLQYTIYKTYAVIDGYTGSAAELAIPAEIEGVPVTTISYHTFRSCSSLVSVELPDSVTTIGNQAFMWCSNLTTINIPDNLTYIDNDAFYDCNSLTSIDIPATVTYIGEDAFAGCASLTGIHVDENNPNYSSDDRGVLFDKGKTLLIQAPGALADAYTVPDGVTRIGDSAFKDCTSLTQVSIPDSVTLIDDSAFYHCTDLDSVNIPDGVTAIGKQAFCNCFSLIRISIPKSVTSLGDNAFESCINLTEIHVDESNPNYSSDDRGVLFDKAKTLLIQAPIQISDPYTLPDGVTTIGEGAFFSCYKLRRIYLPDSLTHIGDSAFYACSSLRRLDLPASLISIGESAFHECMNLTGIHVDENNPYYSSDIRGALFNKDKTVLLRIAQATPGYYEVPDSVITIADDAFIYCVDLKGVFIPDSVTSIGKFAFNDCPFVRKIYIPASVTNIGNDAFSFCQSLNSIYFEGDAPRMYYCTFYDVNATAHYPAGNPTWTEDVMQDYGGDITWEPVTPHEHEYTAAVIDSYCTRLGYTTHICDCGKGYITDYTDELGHNFVEGVCTRCYLVDQSYQPPAENPFTDVSADSFYYEPVLWALEMGITKGLGATRFGPDSSCTRGQVVTFLWRAAGTPEATVTEHPFTDVKEGAYYYKAMLWAVEMGITKGTTASTFGPDKACDRGTVVTFLHRAKDKPAPTSTEHPFTDVSESKFYYTAMLWAVENGITKGTTSTTFAPNNICNRGQVVTFLYRAYAQ